MSKAESKLPDFSWWAGLHAHAINTHRFGHALQKSGLSSRVPMGRKPHAFISMSTNP